MIESTGQSEVLSERWASYSSANDYAGGISWDDVSGALSSFCKVIADSYLRQIPRSEQMWQFVAEGCLI